MAGKVIGFSFVALLALVVAVMLASAVANIRDEGWSWPAFMLLCIAVILAGVAGALGVLVLA
jgi:hypothetical protein